MTNKKRWKEDTLISIQIGARISIALMCAAHSRADSERLAERRESGCRERDRTQTCVCFLWCHFEIQSLNRRSVLAAAIQEHDSLL